MLIYATLFMTGFVELFLNIIDFKLTQKNRAILSSFSTLAHIYLWFYIGRSLFTNINAGIITVTFYAIGCGLGCYLGLKSEPFLEKKILRMQRKGRKVRRGKRLNKRKK